MMVPGSNLLGLALTVIAPQTVAYEAFAGRTRNDVGQYVSTYAAAAPRKGSVQAVPRDLYEQLGLDFQKYYVMFYAVGASQDVARDTSGDQFEFGGKRFEILSLNDWTPIDGWNGALAVQVPIPTPPEPDEA